MEKVEFEEMVDNKEAARILEVEPGTLNQWRSQNKSPEYIRIGNRIRYTLKGLKKYMDENKFTGVGTKVRK